MPSIRERFSKAFSAIVGREQRATPLPMEGMYQFQGMGPQFKPAESLSAYGDNVWLYGAVNKIAQEIARTQFRLQTQNSEGEIEFIQKHQALETLARPQPTKAGKSMLTSMDLKYVSAMHMLLNGEAFWLLDKRLRTGGAPTFIDILLPQYVYEKITNGEITEYVYRLPEREVHLDPMDVVHFKLPDPSKPQRGHSPVQSIRYALDTYKESDVLATKRLEHNAVPAGVLETDQNPSEDARKRLQAQWQQQYGGPANSGKVALLPNGFKFSKVQDTNADMQLVESKNLIRDEILANYGVSLEMLGHNENQTRANAEAAIFIFKQFGALFFIEKFADTLNNDYLIAFPGREDLSFSFPDPVPENMEEKRANAETLFSIGAMTPNEARKQFGLEALDQEGMDTPYMDFGKMPIDAEPPDLSLAA